jgi:hypothetical protein
VETKDLRAAVGAFTELQAAKALGKPLSWRTGEREVNLGSFSRREDIKTGA